MLRHSHRPSRRVALATIAAPFALVLTACAFATEQVTPVPHYTPQPPFAEVLPPSDFAPTTTSTEASFSASYTDEGTPYEPSKILNAAQGGYFPMSNKRWFEDQFPQMSSLGLQHIRIDHVLNEIYYDVVKAEGDGTFSYDFSRLDDRVLGLLDQGFEPLLALSYTPAVFGLNTGDVPPLAEWADAVTALVGHYRDLGYTGWDWEVWNEPDAGKWTGAQYISLYTATAAAVKAADPTARVGGATAAYLTSEGNISGQFIEYIGANPDVPVDFFSVHSYSSDNWDVVTASKEMLAAAGRDLPVLITEWALHPSMEAGAGQGSDTNSSPTGAAYVARRLALAADVDVERVFYFAPVEGWTYSLPYNGDLGLVTVDGHRKAVGNVFALYSGLGDTRIELEASGEAVSEGRAVSGFLSTDSSEQSATVLLWNNTSVDVRATLDISDLPYADTRVRATQSTISSTQGTAFADGHLDVTPIYPTPNENVPVVSDLVLDPSDSYSEQIIVPANGVTTMTLTPTDAEVGPMDIPTEPSSINIASATFGAIATSTSSAEDLQQGWSLESVNDGRRYSVDFGNSPMRGFSSQIHDSDAPVESVTVDLGQSQSIDAVSLWPYTPFMSDSAGFPVDATIRGSQDGETWHTLSAITDYNGGRPVSGEQSFSFPAVEARYVQLETSRLGSIGNGSSYALQLAEIGVFRTGVLDGGFEATALDNWTATEARRTREAAYRGNGGVEILEDGTVSQDITGLQPGKTYTVGVYVRALDRQDSVVVTTVGTTGVSQSSSTAAPRRGWQHVWHNFTTGDDDTSATIKISNTGRQAVWVDEVTLMSSPGAPD